MTSIRLAIQQVHQASPKKSVTCLFKLTTQTARSCSIVSPHASVKNASRHPVDFKIHDLSTLIGWTITNNTYPLPNLPPRPIWLLDPPESLGSSPEKAGHMLVQGPERIESGWWDFEPACRRYWVCLFQHTRISWVYQDHYSKSWWLAGWFT